MWKAARIPNEAGEAVERNEQERGGNLEIEPAQFSDRRENQAENWNPAWSEPAKEDRNAEASHQNSNETEKPGPPHPKPK